MEEANRNNVKFTYAILGDSRGVNQQSSSNYNVINEPVLKHLLNLTKSYNPDFIIFPGDMVLGQWTKGKNHNRQEIINQLNTWKNFVQGIFPDKDLAQFIFPCIGNHEVINDGRDWGNRYSENEVAFNEVFAYLPPWHPNDKNFEEKSGWGKTLYHFDWPAPWDSAVPKVARFICLNSSRTVNSGGQWIPRLGQSQLNWLRERLEKSKELGLKYNFVYLHNPPYPNGGAANIQDNKELWTILDQYNVTAVYVGHEHFYSRRVITDAFYPKQNYNSLYTFYNQIYQITLGGAGGPLVASIRETKNNIVPPLGVYHFMIVQVDGDLVTSKVYDINGDCLDSFLYDRTKVKSFSEDDY